MPDQVLQKTEEVVSRVRIFELWQNNLLWKELSIQNVVKNHETPLKQQQSRKCQWAYSFVHGRREWREDWREWKGLGKAAPTE